jgi:hypothetical protein
MRVGEQAMTPTKSTKIPPQDVAEIYNMLRGMRHELSDSMGCEIQEPMQELIEAHRAWKNGTGNEPDWVAFKLAINQACDNDGMPRLFDNPEGDHDNT